MTVEPGSTTCGTNCGATPAAGVECGLEQIPTVLMAGMEEKLLVPFRAQNRAIHQTRLESKIRARRELRFDQYNHLAAACVGQIVNPIVDRRRIC